MVQRAADGALSAAGRILVSGTPTGLYLAGDRLLVLFQPRREDFVIPDTDRPYPLTGLLTVDVAAPAAPRILGQLLVEGDSLATRRLSDRLHMVVQFGYWPLVAKLNGGVFGKGMPPLVTGEAGVSRELVGQVSDQLLIPRYYRFDAAGALVDTGDAVSGDQVRRPGDTTGSQLVYVLSTSVADAAGALQAAGFVGTAGLVYASTEAVYILEQDYAVGIPVQPLPAVGAPEPGRITMESAAAARALLNEPGTHVYKFSIASGQAQFSASGVVEGAVLDPFSVNERDGILHVVTVSWEAGGTTTRLSTLRQQGDLLEALGRTGPIAPGEQLYSTRFVGDKAYLVTFLRVDPLHTVDLSDPADPRVVGELEVPGYSEYLHPLGGDHLLAIGREVIDDGFGGQRNGGIQLSVFDVSDMADPQLLHNRIVGGSDSWSEALRNHLAFTFQPAAGRLLIPVQTRAWIDTVSPPVWSVADEVLIFGVDVASGIQAQGAIRLPERADRNERFVLRGLLMGEQALAVADDVVAAKPVNALDAPPQQILQLN